MTPRLRRPAWLLGSGGDTAAVDGDSDAADEAGVVAGEVDDGGGDLLGLGQALVSSSKAARLAPQAARPDWPRLATMVLVLTTAP
jgi:hypothetical protein